MILMEDAWAAWPGGDLQERSERAWAGPGVDLQLEGLEERMCSRRKQMTRDLAGAWAPLQGCRDPSRTIAEN
jgi:hypothetical protein